MAVGSATPWTGVARAISGAINSWPLSGRLRQLEGQLHDPQGRQGGGTGNGEGTEEAAEHGAEV
jgi:hypothetical protein